MHCFHCCCLLLLLLCFRLRHFEQQIEKSSREYNMEKLTALKTEVDEATRKFEECQDAYATSMYDFINREQEFTDKIQKVKSSGWGFGWGFECSLGTSIYNILRVKNLWVWTLGDFRIGVVGQLCLM